MQVKTGATLLNLALSDSPDGGFAVGRMVNIIGDSSTGKTMLALSILAEAAHDERFKDYALIYDDVEAALAIPVDKLFGKKTEQRLEEPERGFSETIEDFFASVVSLLRQEKPFIYVLDSFDSLASAEDTGAADELVKKGSISGSYGVQKARTVSQMFRTINADLKNTDSLLIIISQTRDDLNAVFGKKKKRSGGRALDFYSSYIVWLNHKQRLRKGDFVVGNLVEAEVTKNKITGKLRSVEFPIFYEIGIDDVGSVLDFLVKNGRVEKTKLTLSIPELGLKGTRGSVIKEVEANEAKAKDLRKMAGEVWDELEKKASLGRKSKWGEE